MKKEIEDFIAQNKIATVCCVDTEQNPYCFNCFYVFEPINCLLLFKSSAHTFHSKSLASNPNISGSILPERLNMLSMQGVQFTGKVLYDNFPGDMYPANYYHKKNPLALAKAGEVWCIQLSKIKMTDSRRVFAEKLIWEKEQ